jgi:hypothetical protein
MSHPVESPKDAAEHKGRELGDNLHKPGGPDSKVLSETHDAMIAMSKQPAAVRDAFYKAMAGTGDVHLASFEIVHDGNNIQVKEKGTDGKFNNVYDQHATEAAVHKDSEIRRGEGPTAALLRQGYSAHDAVELGRQIRDITEKGAHGFKQHEEYSLTRDNDGKVTGFDVRSTDPKHSGASAIEHYKFDPTKPGHGNLDYKDTDNGYGIQVHTEYLPDGKTPARSRVVDNTSGVPKETRTECDPDGHPWETKISIGNQSVTMRNGEVQTVTGLDDQDKPVTIRRGADGKYTLKRGDEPGIPNGEYKNGEFKYNSNSPGIIIQNSVNLKDWKLDQ